MVVIFADTDKMKLRFFFLFLVLLFFFDTAPALEYLRFMHNGRERNEEGKIFGEDRQGLDFLARDGQAYHIPWENLITRRSDDIPFTPYTKAEVIERLRQEFPANQGYHFLDPYAYGSFIIVYTTSRDFANWYGRLLQRLHEQYDTHWKRHGVELSPPEFPMVAIVFANEASFRQYAQREGVNILREQCAYYHKLTNRIAVYDMSGMQTQQAGNQARAAFNIQRFLTQPDAQNNIRTVIHEAVHQVGFSTGMHPRFVSNPVWVYEGLAIFHEVPNPLNRDIGWTLGPHVNAPRLNNLRWYLSEQHMESPIIKMLQEDQLFNNPATALDNYALAWGLLYYLERRRPKELAAYLQRLQAKTMDSEDTAEIRIKDFESCFGSDWNRFDREFLDFIRRL